MLASLRRRKSNGVHKIHVVPMSTLVLRIKLTWGLNIWPQARNVLNPRTCRASPANQGLTDVVYHAPPRHADPYFKNSSDGNTDAGLRSDFDRLVTENFTQ